MVINSQPIRAIQPMMGMIAISPWTILLLNQPGSWNGHAKLSPTLVTGEECNASRTVRKNRLSTEVSVRALTAAQPIVGLFSSRLRARCRLEIARQCGRTFHRRHL